MNRESDDIDIALDDQTGVEFAMNINDYLTHLGKEVLTIAVIQVDYLQSIYFIFIIPVSHYIHT